MTNPHPSLQPTLGRTNVAMLKSAIQNLYPVYLPPGYGPGYREGYAAGAADAAAQVQMMWDAAVIAADATALDLLDKNDPGDLDLGDPLGDHADHCASCSEMRDGDRLDPYGDEWIVPGTVTDPDAGGGAGGR